MNKNKLIKLALMGMASGLCLTAQTEATELKVKLAMSKASTDDEATDDQTTSDTTTTTDTTTTKTKKNKTGRGDSGDSCGPDKCDGTGGSKGMNKTNNGQHDQSQYDANGRKKRLKGTDQNTDNSKPYSLNEKSENDYAKEMAAKRNSLLNG